MKKYLIAILVWLLTLSIGSLLCHLVYSIFDLSEIFNSEISYLQWVGIVLIVTIVTPSSFKSIKNDAKGIKIP